MGKATAFICFSRGRSSNNQGTQMAAYIMKINYIFSVYGGTLVLLLLVNPVLVKLKPQKSL